MIYVNAAYIILAKISSQYVKKQLFRLSFYLSESFDTNQTDIFDINSPN